MSRMSNQTRLRQKTWILRARPADPRQEPLLSARDVEVTFSLRGNKLTAIRRTSLDLYEGETLAIVGESGSGKSVFTKCFVGMLDKNGSITHGSIMYHGGGPDPVHREGLAAHPRQEDRHGDPGPDDQPEPPQDHRPPDPGERWNCTRG